MPPNPKWKWLYFSRLGRISAVVQEKIKKSETCQSRVSNDLYERVKSSTSSDHLGSWWLAALRITAFFSPLFKPPSLKKKNPADFLEGRLHQQSGETHLTVPPPPPCPLCFTAARGITAPKSFFPAAALGYGKKGIEIPEDFWVHSMWKATFALPSAPLLHVLSSSRLRFPLTSRCWSLLLSLFLLYWLVPSDSDLRLWVWSHADSSFFFFRPHCAPMPPRSPLGCSCFTFALSIIIFSRFKEIFS